MARILVADDSPMVKLLLRRHLQAEDHEVVEASDGTSAYELGTNEETDPPSSRPCGWCKMPKARERMGRQLRADQAGRLAMKERTHSRS